MPFVLPALVALGTSVGTGLAAAGTALGVAAGALAAGNFALLGTALLAVGDASLVGGLTVGSVLTTGILAGASLLLAPHPKINTAGSPQTFKSDPLPPIPFVMARYGVGGANVYETVSGGASKASAGAAGNEFLSQFVVLGGLGPYAGVEKLQLDDTVLTFGGQACTGGYIDSEYVQAYNPGYKQNSNGSYQNNNYSSHVWQTLQFGAHDQGGMPYPDKLNTDKGPLTEWTSAHGFNLHAAACIVRSYNTSVWSGGPGQPLWTLASGYPVYDPRKDSTYPGGSGPQRWAGPGATAAQLWAARATWAPSSNPAIHGLNYALGFFIPDKDGVVRRYAGVGAGLAGVDVGAFVEAANVSDSNGWTCTGQWTSKDGRRSVLVAMLQAGGAQLVSDRGRISCTVSCPRTALNAGSPLTWADLADAPTLDTSVSVRERFNSAFVRYTSEAHRWQEVQADTVIEPATYIAEDGGVVRATTVQLGYVPDVNQACQLAAYAICDGREVPNIVLPGKPHLRGYDVGDCLMVDLPELGLHLAKLVVLKRSHDPSTEVVTLTCRTETDAKHAYALGVSGVAPPTPGISGFDPAIVPAPIPGSWTAAPASYEDISGEIVHVIRINGSTIDNVYAAQVVVSYQQVFTGQDGGLTYGPWKDQTYPATLESIDLSLPAGRWHLELHYVTIHGSEDVENTLDLGIVTVAADQAASAASVPATATVGGSGQTMQEALDDLAGAKSDVGALQKDVGSLQDGLADATATATSAQSIAANSRSLNANSFFALYGQATGVPDSWFDYVDGDQASRVALTTGFACRLQAAASQNFLGIQSGAIAASPGAWYVIEVEALLNAGSLVGSGVILQQTIGGTTGQPGAQSVSGTATLILSSDADTGGAVNGAGSPGTTYRFAKLVQLNASNGGDHVNLVVSAHHASLGDASQAADLTFCEASYRPASSSEILAQAVDSKLSALSATVDDVQKTQVDRDKSFASDVRNVAAVAGQDGQADVQTIAGALASLDGKNLAWLQELVQAAGSAPAKFQAVSGDGTSLIGMVARVLSLASSSEAGQEVDVLTITNGEAYFADKVFIGSNLYLDPGVPALIALNGGSQAIFGDGFGANGDMILWAGPANVAAGSAARSNAYLCIDANGLYIPPSANTAVTNDGAAQSASAGSDWTDVATANFSLSGQGYWINPEGSVSGYAASQPGAPASYVTGGKGATGDMRLIERVAGQSAFTVIAEADGGLSASADQDGATIAGDVSAGRVRSASLGSVQLVLQARCTTAGRSFSGFPAQVVSTWTPTAS